MAKFKVGDKVRNLRSGKAEGNYLEKGEVTTITRVASLYDGIQFYGVASPKGDVTRDESELEAVKPEPKTTFEHKFKVGDKVQNLKAGEGNYLELYEETVITRVPDASGWNGRYYEVATKKNGDVQRTEGQLRLVPKLEPKFKLGDVVAVKTNAYPTLLPVGTVAPIKRVSPNAKYPYGVGDYNLVLGEDEIELYVEPVKTDKEKIIELIENYRDRQELDAKKYNDSRQPISESSAISKVSAAQTLIYLIKQDI